MRLLYEIRGIRNNVRLDQPQRMTPAFALDSTTTARMSYRNMRLDEFLGDPALAIACDALGAASFPPRLHYQVMAMTTTLSDLLNDPMRRIVQGFTNSGIRIDYVRPWQPETLFALRLSVLVRHMHPQWEGWDKGPMTRVCDCVTREFHDRLGEFCLRLGGGRREQSDRLYQTLDRFVSRGIAYAHELEWLTQRNPQAVVYMAAASYGLEDNFALGASSALGEDFRDCLRLDSEATQRHMREEEQRRRLNATMPLTQPLPLSEEQERALRNAVEPAPPPPPPRVVRKALRPTRSVLGNAAQLVSQGDVLTLETTETVAVTSTQSRRLFRRRGP